MDIRNLKCGDIVAFTYFAHDKRKAPDGTPLVVLPFFDAVGIVDRIYNSTYPPKTWFHCISFDAHKQFKVNVKDAHIGNLRMAKKNERQALLESIERHGYEWDAENNVLSEKPFWQPQIGEKYYFIDSDGTVKETVFQDLPLDKGRIGIGNYFEYENVAKCTKTTLLDRLHEIKRYYHLLFQLY